MKYSQSNTLGFGILTFAVLMILAGPAQGQPLFSWVRNSNNSYPSAYNSVAVCPDRSVVALGQMYYFVSLGTTNFYGYAQSSHYDALLTRYSAAGEVAWARADGGYSHEYGRGLSIDASGNLYSWGTFQGTAYFDATNIVTAGAEDVFLAKYSASGQFLWVIRAGGSSSDFAPAVCIDQQGNPVVVGSFNASIDFGSTNLVAAGGQSVFAAKYSPTGTLLWAAKLGGAGSAEAKGVASGPGGEIYVAGWFDNNLMYDDRCLFTAGSRDGFVARFELGGALGWLRPLGSPGTDMAQAVAVASNGDVWTCGSFSSLLPFGATNLTPVGSFDAFVAKYSSNGTPIFARSFGGNADDYATALALDSESNAYVAGYHSSSPMMFPGTNIFTTGGYDAYFLRLDSSGNFRWATRAGGGNNDYAYGIAVAQDRDIYLAGSFAYNATFGSTNVANGTDPGLFLAKYSRDLPTFVTQPLSKALTEGGTLALSVTVTGTGPFSYQWKFNGGNIPGLTNATFVLPGITTNLSGSYSVLVRNYEGAVLSDTSAVDITSFTGALETTNLTWSTGGDAPWYSQTTITYDGLDAARSGAITNNQQSWLQTEVLGPARVSFAWKISSENGYDFLRFSLNGTEVTNTSGKIEWKGVSFLMPPGTNALRWTYTKDGSESVGSDAGWLDAVVVAYAPAVVVPPMSQVVTSGISVSLSAVVSGSTPLSYQWQFFGTNLPGATDATLTLNNVQPAQSGAYTLIASNTAGIAVSAPAMLTILVPPSITSQPVDQTVSSGDTASFAVSVGGAGPHTYQWLLNGIIIGGATNATLLITNAQSEQVGAYRALVTGVMGSTLSDAARLTLIGLVMRPTLSIEGVVGSSYHIDYRMNVNQVNWVTLTNVVLTSSPYHYVDFSAQSQPRRFYRVVGQ